MNKSAEAPEIQSRKFLESVVENIPNMIFVKDSKDLRFVRFNKAGEDLLGYPRNDLIGKNDYDFFPKEQADFFTENDRKVLAGKVVVDIPEESISTKNGVKFLHTKKIPILDAQGNPTYLLGISEDITQNKLLEEQQIMLARERAANQAKTAFLANISHELRTPLSAMLGFLELLEDDNTMNPLHNDYLSTISRNGHQLLSIINEILDLSKIQASGLTVKKIGMSTFKVLRDVVQLLNIQAHAKGITLDLHIADDVPDRIISDPDRIRQILINLIGNAIKFTVKGSVGLEVKLGDTDPDTENKAIEILINDTGIGISSEQAQALFQPFAQADPSTTRKYGGTGLGLHLSKLLANALGGDVMLKKSMPQQGSQFCLSIPAVLEKFNSVSGEESIQPKSKRVHFSDLKILFVEDSADNRQLVKIRLTKMGFNIDVAENGTDGLQKAAKEKYHIILQDIEMPDMDGFQVLSTLRAKGYSGRVVALTAHAMEGYKDYCLKQGFDDYLTKPINQAALYDCLVKNAELIQSN